MNSGMRSKDLYTTYGKLKNEDGSFSVHEGGESDVRGTYTAVCQSTMKIFQALRRPASWRHVLEGACFNQTIFQCDSVELGGTEAML